MDEHIPLLEDLHKLARGFADDDIRAFFKWWIDNVDRLTEITYLNDMFNKS